MRVGRVTVIFNIALRRRAPRQQLPLAADRAQRTRACGVHDRHHRQPRLRRRRASASTSAQMTRLTVFVRGDNVGDTVYENALGYPGLPRGVMAGVRFNVGARP